MCRLATCREPQPPPRFNGVSGQKLNIWISFFRAGVAGQGFFAGLPAIEDIVPCTGLCFRAHPMLDSTSRGLLTWRIGGLSRRVRERWTITERSPASGLTIEAIAFEFNDEATSCIDHWSFAVDRSGTGCFGKSK